MVMWDRLLEAGGRFMKRRAVHNRPALTKGPLILRTAAGVRVIPNQKATRAAYVTLDKENVEIENLTERRRPR